MLNLSKDFFGSVSRSIKIAVGFWLTLLISVSPTLADPDGDAYAALNSFSALTSKTINDAGCLVTASTDFNKFSGKLAIFRDAWLSRDYSIDFYQQRQKQIFVYVVVKRLAELVTEGIYQNKQFSSTCSFSITVAYDDKFGAPQKMTVATWKFDNATNQKMVWEKFDPINFADIAVDYKVSPDAVAWFSSEPGMSDSKSSDTKQACQMDMLDANASFIRATTYCKKDYMDTPAGVYALAMSRQCAQSMTDNQMKESFLKSASQVDGIAKKRGRSGVCAWMDKLESEVEQKIN